MSVGAQITLIGDNITVLQGVYGALTGSHVEVFKKADVRKLALSFDKSYVVVTTTRDLRFCVAPGREPEGILWVETFNGAAYADAESLYNAIVALY